MTPDNPRVMEGSHYAALPPVLHFFRKPKQGESWTGCEYAHCTPADPTSPAVIAFLEKNRREGDASE